MGKVDSLVWSVHFFCPATVVSWDQKTIFIIVFVAKRVRVLRPRTFYQNSVPWCTVVRQSYSLSRFYHHHLPPPRTLLLRCAYSTTDCQLVHAEIFFWQNNNSVKLRGHSKLDFSEKTAFSVCSGCLHFSVVSQTLGRPTVSSFSGSWWCCNDLLVRC